MAGEADNPSASPFRLQKFRLLLVDYWWIPASALLFSLIVAAVQVLHQPATFLSTGSMWETMKLQFPGGSLFSENAEGSAGTQSDLLHSSLIRDRTFAKLQAASNHVAIPLDAHGAPLHVTVRISQSSKSDVFTLEALGSQPVYTQAYLEALMQAYLEYKAQIRGQISGDTLASIATQVKLAEQELKKQQEIQAEFERTKNLAILQEEGTVAGGYLTKLKTSLSDLEADERLLNTALTKLAESNSGQGQTNQITLELEALASRSGPETAEISTKLQNKATELELLKMQRASLGIMLNEHSPEIQKVDSDIERATMELNIYRRQGREQLAATAEGIRLKVDILQKTIKDWEDRVVDVNSHIADADRLKNDLQRIQGEYDRLTALMQNFKISRDFDQESLAILENASPAIRSYSTMKKTLGTTILGGLMMGFSCIVLLAIRDDKFGSVQEVREQLFDNVIAQVPEWPEANGKLKLPAIGAQSHLYAESYRSLRSSLLFISEEVTQPRIILITSALPEEGKSTIAANLAHTLALGGARVLLVDADLRRGRLHELLHLQQEPGLSQLLNSPADTDKIIQPNSLPNLSFISCGTQVTNPGDLLLGAPLDVLLASWRSRFDYVLIDSCPVFAADDTTTLAAKVDGTILVVRRRFSSMRQVRGALDTLLRRRARILGVVFNRADASSRSYDHYKCAEYYAAADTAAP